jgi:hypothetical protein
MCRIWYIIASEPDLAAAVLLGVQGGRTLSVG